MQTTNDNEISRLASELPPGEPADQGGAELIIEPATRAARDLQNVHEIRVRAEIDIERLLREDRDGR